MPVDDPFPPDGADIIEDDEFGDFENQDDEISLEEVMQKMGGGELHAFGSLAEEPYRRDTPKIGRNDPCICGSGKKFKKCCEGRI